MSEVEISQAGWKTHLHEWSVQFRCRGLCRKIQKTEKHAVRSSKKNSKTTQLTLNYSNKVMHKLSAFRLYLGAHWRSKLKSLESEPVVLTAQTTSTGKPCNELLAIVKALDKEFGGAKNFLTFKEKFYNFSQDDFCNGPVFIVELRNDFLFFQTDNKWATTRHPVFRDATLSSLLHT